jgi:EmrB/QacA subfamily drug resistance transporter
VTSEVVGPDVARTGTDGADAARKWWVVVAMSGVMIILTLDFFGLTVALPAIGHDLNASTSTLLWTVNGYLLAFVAPMIAIGRLADIVGRRKIALIGIVLFVIGSIGCAVAPTDVFLICARVVQGIGGGSIFTVSVSIVNNAFPPDDRAKALGIWSGVGLAGSAIGPFVAGVLTQYASWRWFFFLNVPIGVITFGLTLRYVDESRDESFTGGIDWTGFVLLTTGFVPLIFGMQQAAESGWSSPLVFGPIVLGVGLLAAFAWSELHMRSRLPLVEFSLFRDARFAGANVVAFIGNWMFGSILFFLTLYLQNVLNLDALETGMVFLVFSVPLVAMSPIGGRMVERYGAQQLMAIGMALVGAGVTCFAFIDTDTGVGLVVIGLVLAGFGQGFAYNLSNTAGMESMPDEKAGVASGVLQTSRLMGIVVGLALSGALFKSFENRQLFSDFHAATGRLLSSSNRSEVRGLLSGSDEARQRLAQLGHHSQSIIDKVVDQAFVHGLRAVMVLSLVLCALAIWPALWGRTVPAGREGRHPRFAHPHWALTWRRTRRPEVATTGPPVGGTAN